jgi:hypothetical protein
MDESAETYDTKQIRNQCDDTTATRHPHSNTICLAQSSVHLSAKMPEDRPKFILVAHSLSIIEGFFICNAMIKKKTKELPKPPPVPSRTYVTEEQKKKQYLHFVEDDLLLLVEPSSSPLPLRSPRSPRLSPHEETSSSAMNPTSRSSHRPAPPPPPAKKSPDAVRKSDVSVKKGPEPPRKSGVDDSVARKSPEPPRKSDASEALRRTPEPPRKSGAADGAPKSPDPGTRVAKPLPQPQKKVAAEPKSHRLSDMLADLEGEFKSLDDL